jgi:glycosyltransferase involved in cell wall biosynthesis
MTVAGIRNAGSTGVERYVRLLAASLAHVGVDYRCGAGPARGSHAHWHLANSSRGALWQTPLHRRPYVVTLHDVVPRTPALAPVYRSLVYPLVLRRAARVIVHSAYAADLLAEIAGIRAVDVVPHPAPRMPELSRAEARLALGWSGEAPIAVLPGAARAVKLVAEAVAATAGTPWRLALVGEPRDAALVRSARANGALVLPHADETTYQHALLAADCVLVLRRGSVGETNGPLLDALGAGRAVLATATGSIPEVAGGAAELCAPETGSVREGLRLLLDDGRRSELERRTARRGTELDWSASAHAHRAIFEEVFG